MTNPKHTITVTLSESAQREAILAGQPSQREQTYEVPAELLPRLLALPWTTVHADGSATCNAPARVGASEQTLESPPGADIELTRASLYWKVDVPAESRPADAGEATTYAEQALQRARDAVERSRREKADRRATIERRERECAERWAALPLEWRASEHGVLTCRPSGTADDYRGQLYTSGGQIVSEKTLEQYAPEALAEARAEVQRLIAAARARREAEAQTWRAQLRDLIGANGKSDQLERFDAGVLPEPELDELVGRVLFKPLAGFRGYEEISEQEVADECECDVDDVRFHSVDYDGPFSAEQWQALQAVRKAAPTGAEVTAREHRGYERGNSDYPSILRYGIRVTVEFAGAKYQREYAL